MLFCAAADHAFCVSLDNLSGETTDPAPFKRRVVEQVQTYLREGIPERPACFIDALLNHYRPDGGLDPAAFTLDRL